MEELSEENKSIEVATVTGKAYDELWNLSFLGIPGFPYVMKYKFDEDGYTLMVSDLAAVYGEKLDEKNIQERFQILNPHVEMLPKVILKHVKQSLKNMWASEQARGKTALQINLDSYPFSIHQEFEVSGVCFIFDFKLEKLSDNQFRAHILSPVLLKALFLDEEKAALERKLELLDGRPSTSSSGYQRRNVKAIYSAINVVDPPKSEVVKGFLHIQKDRIILPKSLAGIPILDVSPNKEVHSPSTSSFRHSRIQDLAHILYNEDDSDASLESQNAMKPEITIKIDDDDDVDTEREIQRVNAEDDENMNLFYDVIEDLVEKNKKRKSEKSEMAEEDDKKKSESPEREMAEEDSKEESASEPTRQLNPSPAKKKKLLKF